jgi:hypothetical protein
MNKLRIADCGLQIDQSVLALTAQQHAKLSWNPSSIRNPQSAIRNPQSALCASERMGLV